MIKNIALIFSILLLSIFLVSTAYILKNKDICCEFELCKQVTSLCISNNEDENEKDNVKGEVLSEKGEKIYFENLKSGDEINVDFKILGKVPSNWFFEGMFPVRVLDVNGEEILLLYATTQDDIFNDEYVDFSVDLSSFVIDIDKDLIVVLRFEKDNPSGLDVNSDKVDISVTLKPKEESKLIGLKVFFPNSKLNDMQDCSLVYPVVRNVPKTVAVGRASLEELFKGVSESEKGNGYFTNINEGVTIQSLSIENGVAKVNLSKELEEGVGGSCRVLSIRSQITETLKQFSTVDSVTISIDGRIEDILQP